MISGLYVYVAVGIASAAMAATGAWQVQNWRYGALEADRLAMEAKAKHVAEERAYTASTTVEEKKAVNEIKYRTVTVTLEKIVDRPVYLQQCFDDTGMHAINAQINRNDPSQPGIKLPKP